VGASKIRVLVMGGVWPYLSGNIEAANVVSYEIVRCLAEDPRFEVALACVSSGTLQPQPAGATRDLDRLRGLGVRIFPEVLLEPAQRLPRWRRRLLTLLADPLVLIPGAGQETVLLEKLGAWRPDIVLTIWSERATGLASGLEFRKMAYYGNPDHKVVRAMAELDWNTRRASIGAGAFFIYLRLRLLAWAIERAHLKVMRRMDAVGDVALNDANYYAANGVRAFYVRNMWTQQGLDWERKREAAEQLSPLKIIGNVGRLSATGNSHGLGTLAREVVPALGRKLRGAFEVHLFGGGEPHPGIAPFLCDPRIRLRGFVLDLDAEILSAPVFLVANNHARFKVGHTRFLHAWALGACVVAFRDSALSMPELENGRNALLARDAEEMADLVAAAADDATLRRSIGRAGYETVSTLFRPAAALAPFKERMLALAGRGA
jgi:hypothetical protein